MVCLKVFHPVYSTQCDIKIVVNRGGMHMRFKLLLHHHKFLGFSVYLCVHTLVIKTLDCHQSLSINCHLINISASSGLNELGKKYTMKFYIIYNFCSLLYYRIFDLSCLILPCDPDSWWWLLTHKASSYYSRWKDKCAISHINTFVTVNYIINRITEITKAQ